MKTLNDAIGCWTVNTNGLRGKASLISSSTQYCRTATIKNNPQKLLSELLLLQTRTQVMTELVSDAINRCSDIIHMNELLKP